jgi:hypothetical protein
MNRLLLALACLPAAFSFGETEDPNACSSARKRKLLMELHGSGIMIQGMHEKLLHGESLDALFHDGIMDEEEEQALRRLNCGHAH